MHHKGSLLHDLVLKVAYFQILRIKHSGRILQTFRLTERCWESSLVIGKSLSGLVSRLSSFFARKINISLFATSVILSRATAKLSLAFDVRFDAAVAYRHHKVNVSPARNRATVKTIAFNPDYTYAPR